MRLTPDEAKKIAEEMSSQEIIVKLDLMLNNRRAIPDRILREAIRNEVMNRLENSK